MSWTQTHRRWSALREVEALAAAGCTELPWNAEYAEIFGDRDGLAAALRYRLNLARSAQLDPSLGESALEERRQLLASRSAGIVAILQAHAAGRAAAPAQQPTVRTVSPERASA